MAVGQGRLNKLYKNNTKNQLNTNFVLQKLEQDSHIPN